jgi:hypothetical protein
LGFDPARLLLRQRVLERTEMTKKRPKKVRKRAPDVQPMAYLNIAREYHDAAEVLFAASEQRPRVSNRRAMTNPINLLYVHTVELALKAFLRFHERPICKDHKVSVMYKECRELGLVKDGDDKLTIENIVHLLESGNVDQAFRYFNLNSTTEPDVAWTREAVGELMQTVSGKIPARPPGRAAKVTLIVDKPTRVPRHHEGV